MSTTRKLGEYTITITSELGYAKNKKLMDDIKLIVDGKIAELYKENDDFRDELYDLKEYKEMRDSQDESRENAEMDREFYRMKGL